MKNLMIVILSAVMLFACKASDEDRYSYEEDRVIDTETGDEYYLSNMDTLTVVHIDGDMEEIVVTEAPFYGSEEMESLIQKHKKELDARKELLFMEQKNVIKSDRGVRYSTYSDEELMEEFNKRHKDGAAFEQQMDVMAELVERGVIKRSEAPELMEVDPDSLDFEIEFDTTEFDTTEITE